MAEAMLDLWPADLKAEMRSPLAILRGQAMILTQRMRGNIEAEVHELAAAVGEAWQLDVVAPRLNRQRIRICTIYFDREQIYPVVVSAPAFLPRPRPKGGVTHIMETMRASLEGVNAAADPMYGKRSAATDDDFTALLGEVFKSDQARGAIATLLVRLSEKDEEDAAEQSRVLASEPSSSIGEAGGEGSGTADERSPD